MNIIGCYAGHNKPSTKPGTSVNATVGVWIFNCGNCNQRFMNRREEMSPSKQSPKCVFHHLCYLKTFVRGREQEREIYIYSRRDKLRSFTYCSLTLFSPLSLSLLRFLPSLINWL